MPQLNPAPWFMVFLTTWFALLLYSTKTTKLQEPNTPMMPESPAKKEATWQWP
uniref:ATP synthase complex subunit 8 n=1 Tax=Callopistes maculatus TaxID=271259 RepID=A0A348B075_9SAUR|nr:ATPase subunit 8 [Callopistes maculatus]